MGGRLPHELRGVPRGQLRLHRAYGVYYGVRADGLGRQRLRGPVVRRVSRWDRPMYGHVALALERLRRGRDVPTVLQTYGEDDGRALPRLRAARQARRVRQRKRVVLQEEEEHLQEAGQERRQGRVILYQQEVQKPQDGNHSPRRVLLLRRVQKGQGRLRRRLLVRGLQTLGQEQG